MERKIRNLGVLNASSFHVELDEVERAGGRTTRRLAVRHPSAVAVLPLLGDDETLLVVQHRYPLDRETLEFPAGKMERGEKPEQAALRELAEETGFSAGRLTPLLSFAPSVGYSDEIIHVFTAHELQPLDQGRDELEISGVERIKLSRLKEMVLAGEIIDGTTILVLAAYEWLGQGRKM